MNRLCTICARGGSKGVKNKNIRPLLDKPLIAHSIIQARDSNIFKYIAVSSDSEEILDISKKYGADFIIERPTELATDQAAKLPVIKHCVTTVIERSGENFETIVDLDATSPLREVDDIVNCVKLLEEKKVSNVITGMPARRSPYFNLVELGIDGYVKLSKQLETQIIRRQDSPKCFDMNASIYVWTFQSLMKSSTIFNKDTMLYEMPEERSIDIDNELDFEFVEFIAKKRGLL